MLYFKSKLIRTSCSDTCNLCGNKLILCKGYKYTSIDKCSNVECISNKFPSSKLYRLGFADDSNTFIKREDQISYWQEHMGHTNINDARAARYDFMLRSLNGELKSFTRGQSVWSKDFLIDRGYNAEKAVEIVQERKSITSQYQVKFWTSRGFTETDAKLNISKLQAKNAGKVNYENRVLPSNITWWTSKGYNEFDAIKEQQKFYKEKYSVTRKNCPSYDNMMKNRQNTWASKSSEERAEINKTRGKTFDELVQKFGIKKALSIIDKRNAAFKTKNWSKISKQCFIKIEKLIADKCYYAENEKLFYVNKKRYYADFSYKNIIIEFNGDIFHANPDIYTATDHPNPYAPHLTAQDIWLNDMKRKTAFESAGFSYYVIWENDYNNSKHIATEMYEKIKTKII